jgi:hypothetical protein
MMNNVFKGIGCWGARVSVAPSFRKAARRRSSEGNIGTMAPMKLFEWTACAMAR